MYVPPHLLIRSLRAELSPLLGEHDGEASARQGIESALTLLEVRETGGVAFLHRRFEQLRHMLEQLVGLPGGDPAWQGALQPIIAQCRQAEQGEVEHELVARWNALQAKIEQVLGAAVGSTSVAAPQRRALVQLLGEWEVADRVSLTSRAADGTVVVDTRLTGPAFEAYLRDRFSEPSLRVTEFRQLSGGFGKETFLVKVEGQALDGELVIRRDPIEATVDNDCHFVKNEYPVIKAAYARGFPAPDALWVDSEHKLLPGGDFMVMRRSPGATGGHVFGATEMLSDELVEVLAVAMARLHNLPPLQELGDLTESIRSDIWDLSIQEAMRRYIQGWLDIYLRETHSPSPTLVALYGWLLENVPAAEGRPVLLHADLGFHNMLIDNGRLTALVDWEFSHIGDPAEDLGAAKNTSGNYSWETFERHYRAEGGPELSPERLHFYRIWHYVRNASASNLTMGQFAKGALTDLKLAYTGHFHFPLFLRAACDLLAAGPEGPSVQISY